MISKQPFMNEIGKLPDAFKASQAANFSDWRLTVDGLVEHPLSLSVSDLRTLATRSQITEVACEEGWSYIAEWIGTPLSSVLREAGLKPEARFLAYFSIQPDWWDSLDLADALHPGTLRHLGNERRRSSRRLRRPHCAFACHASSATRASSSSRASRPPIP